MLEDVADLGTREPLVDGHENAARRGDAEMGLEHRGGVSEKRGDSISLVETGRSEPVGELPRAFCELASGAAGAIVPPVTAAPPEISTELEEPAGGAAKVPVLVMVCDAELLVEVKISLPVVTSMLAVN